VIVASLVEELSVDVCASVALTTIVYVPGFVEAGTVMTLLVLLVIVQPESVVPLLFFALIREYVIEPEWPAVAASKAPALTAVAD
jgi:hypothetical protein